MEVTAGQAKDPGQRVTRVEDELREVIRVPPGTIPPVITRTEGGNKGQASKYSEVMFLLCE